MVCELAFSYRRAAPQETGNASSRLPVNTTSAVAQGEVPDRYFTKSGEGPACCGSVHTFDVVIVHHASPQVECRNATISGNQFQRTEAFRLRPNRSHCNSLTQIVPLYPEE